MERLCTECHEPNMRGMSAVYCSVKCAKRVEHRLYRQRKSGEIKAYNRDYYRKAHNVQVTDEKKCLHCQGYMGHKRPDAKYCSDACLRAAHKIRWRKANPEKLAAHKAIEFVIAKGWLKADQACSKCGRNDQKIYGHHDDYDKPLEVIWLCGGCHMARHKMLNEQRSSAK